MQSGEQEWRRKQKHIKPDILRFYDILSIYACFLATNGNTTFPSNKIQKENMAKLLKHEMEFCFAFSPQGTNKLIYIV